MARIGVVPVPHSKYDAIGESDRVTFRFRNQRRPRPDFANKRWGVRHDGTEER
jgi:hypothetical protein